MRISGFCFAVAFLAVPVASAQTSVTKAVRDPQAVALVQKAIAAMGPTPTDSSATGIIDITEGSDSETGTVQILTLGTDASSETISLPSGERVVVYSDLHAREVIKDQSTSTSLEAALTDQCPDFPLPLLSSLLANPDVSVRYVAAESVDGRSVQHIRLWKSFASKPQLQSLAAFSTRDVWIDPVSGLPLKIAYFRRTAGGTAPAVPMEVEFSNYNKVSGVLYPFLIQKSCNGTPWQTITIQNVSFDTGLTDAQFQVQ